MGKKNMSLVGMFFLTAVEHWTHFVKKITNLQAQHSKLFYGFYYAATSSFFSAFFDTFGCINSYNINSAISVDVCTLAFSKVSY